MWSMEVTAAVPAASDSDRLAEIAGKLVEQLEEAAGKLAPVVVARFQPGNPVVVVAVDIARDDPTNAVSDALEIINRAARYAEVSLGDIQAITLNIADNAEYAAELASA